MHTTQLPIPIFHTNSIKSNEQKQPCAINNSTIFHSNLKTKESDKTIDNSLEIYLNRNNNNFLPLTPTIFHEKKTSNLISTTNIPTISKEKYPTPEIIPAIQLPSPSYNLQHNINDYIPHSVPPKIQAKIKLQLEKS